MKVQREYNKNYKILSLSASKEQIEQSVAAVTNENSDLRSQVEEMRKANVELMTMISEIYEKKHKKQHQRQPEQLEPPATKSAKVNVSTTPVMNANKVL